MGGPRRTQLTLTNSSVAPSGPSAFNLVIAPSAMAANSLYSFKLVANSTHPSGTGSGAIAFLTNTVR